MLQTKIKSLALRTLTDVTLTEKSNGEGTITFGNTSPFAVFHNTFGFPGMSPEQPPQFEALAQARTVYNIIRDAQKNTWGISSIRCTWFERFLKSTSFAVVR